MGRKFLILQVLCLLLLAFGCAPKAYRVHPDFDTLSKNIKSPSLIPPDIKVYEFTVGGIQELRDDWSATARANVLKIVTETFKEMAFEIKTMAIDKDIEDELEDIQALYRAVSTSIQLHTYNQQTLFPEKLKNFDYSIGSIEKILHKYGTDALILVYGFDEIPTGGRKALTAAGIIIGVFTGVIVAPRAGITALSIALIDSSGTVLWYSFKGMPGYDLREPENAINLTKGILSDFPSLRK
ncbi:MAG: hypothetical protein M0Z70_08050 [Nitrospiraceae bacterium]|nr:hypothetical protein [Nitrospirota bacterium]MDA8339234.1 hypothetical protein [Nitrospiraceae bacterium]